MHARQCRLGADLECFALLPHLSVVHPKDPGKDGEGTHPFVKGETSSTTAHRGALTLSTGLGGRGNPERPLVEDLISGIGTKFTSYNPFHVQSNSGFDPPAVDSTAELDQIISAQYVAANARRVRSPNSEQSTSSSSEPDTPEPTSSRPKLSDSLSYLTFFPKRPRSPVLQLRSASPTLPYSIVLPAEGRPHSVNMIHFSHNHISQLHGRPPIVASGHPRR